MKRSGHGHSVTRMLDERRLVRYSFALSLIGIGLLFVVVRSMEAPFVPLANITTSMVGQVVRASGQVKAWDAAPGAAFLRISAGGTTRRIVLFEKDAQSFEKGDAVAVEGTVAFYKGELEIIAKRVWKP